MPGAEPGSGAPRQEGHGAGREAETGFEGRGPQGARASPTGTTAAPAQHLTGPINHQQVPPNQGAWEDRGKGARMEEARGGQDEDTEVTTERDGKANERRAGSRQRAQEMTRGPDPDSAAIQPDPLATQPRLLCRGETPAWRVTMLGPWVLGCSQRLLKALQRPSLPGGPPPFCLSETPSFI